MLRRMVVVVFVFAGLSAPSTFGAASPTKGLILHSWQTRDGRVSQAVWCDQADWRARTLDYDASGRVAGQTVVSIRGRTVRTDSVIYAEKAWRTSTYPLSPSAYDVGIADSQYFPAAIRRFVKQGLFGAVGPRRRVAGYETIHLQGQLGSGLVEYWVRPGSYLIVRARQTPVGNGGPGGAGETINFSWLTDTPANLAKTRLVVPHGFAHQG